MKVRLVSIAFGLFFFGASLLIPYEQRYLAVIGGILVGIGVGLVFRNSFRREQNLGGERHDLDLEVELATTRILRSATSGNKPWRVVYPSLPKVEETAVER